MHVFPCLATAVKTCPARRDKTLKVVRVEAGGEKTLGVKFPVYKVEELKHLLFMVKEARKGVEGKYKEGDVEFMDARRLRAAGRPQNTMLTFFGKGPKRGAGVGKSVFTSSSSASSKRSAFGTTSSNVKRDSGKGKGGGMERKKRKTLKSVTGKGQARLAFGTTKKGRDGTVDLT